MFIYVVSIGNGKCFGSKYNLFIITYIRMRMIIAGIHGPPYRGWAPEWAALGGIYSMSGTDYKDISCMSSLCNMQTTVCKIK